MEQNSDDLNVGMVINEAKEHLEEVIQNLSEVKVLSVETANKIYRHIRSLSRIFKILEIDEFIDLCEIKIEIIEFLKESEDIPLEYNAEFLDDMKKSLNFVMSIIDTLKEHKLDKEHAREIKRFTEVFKKIKDDISNCLINLTGNVTTEEILSEDLDFGKEMIEAFITESLEYMDIIENNTLALIEKPENQSLIEDSFRQMHSFKGNCGIFSFSDLEVLGHKVESVFDAIINHKIESDKKYYEYVIKVVDVIRDKIISIGNDGDSNIKNLSQYKDTLDSFLDGVVVENEETQSSNMSDEENSKQQSNEIPKITKDKDPIEEKIGKEDQYFDDVFKTMDTIKRKDVRVDINKLDQLNNLVGELVTAKTMIYENIRTLPLGTDLFDKSFQFLGRVAAELHDVAMNIRMVPIAGLFKKLIRIIHDISIKSGKKIDFIYYGDDTEVDKTLIEKLSDPLIHMIRNAVDHGIESGEQRILKGKKTTGRLVLRARNEGGEVVITLQDDGQGIKKDDIIEKAISKNIIHPDMVESLQEGEIFDLIFYPGFSTAKKVTGLSGRGVGLDVVKKNIEELKGRILLKSVLNEGSTFTIKVPLTLAIMKGMLIHVGNVKYTIPIENVLEAIKVTSQQIVRPMEDQELIKIRGSMLPIIRLDEFHGIESTISRVEEGILIVVEGKGRQMALLVDFLMGQHEAVVKPLPRYFNNLKGVSGCSILGNGDASLILDTGMLLDYVDKL